jgi:hypothetical protein
MGRLAVGPIPNLIDVLPEFLWSLVERRVDLFRSRVELADICDASLEAYIGLDGTQPFITGTEQAPKTPLNRGKISGNYSQSINIY